MAPMKQEQQNPPEVAIIMRSKDEMPYPPATLEALEQQTHQAYHLYIVDSGSTDGSLEVLRSVSSHKLVEIAPEDYVPGRVLNQMVSITTEPIVVFLNADAIPQGEHWLERLLEPILSGQTDATMSKQVTRQDCLFIVDYDYRRAYLPQNIKAENADFFSAVSCAFKRELWEQQPFYEEGYAEDLVWAARSRQQGARFQLVLDSVVEHSHNYSIKALHRKKYRHGVVFARLYGQRPRFWYQMFSCLKEWVRDFLEALRQMRVTTIPYNIYYRLTIHKALYQGISEGMNMSELLKTENLNNETKS